jgi:hypothetical protein
MKQLSCIMVARKPGLASKPSAVEFKSKLTCSFLLLPSTPAQVLGERRMLAVVGNLAADCTWVGWKKA